MKKKFQIMFFGLMFLIIFPLADFGYCQEYSQDISQLKNFNWWEKTNGALEKNFYKFIFPTRSIIAVKSFTQKTYSFLGKKEKIPQKKEGPSIGMATHYGEGDGYHGKRMANGELMNKNAISAAHRTYPLGMLVMIINLENGRAIETIIKDRGPYSKNKRGQFTREIDLSTKTAEVLGFKEKGVTLVEIIPLT